MVDNNENYYKFLCETDIIYCYKNDINNHKWNKCFCYCQSYITDVSLSSTYMHIDNQMKHRQIYECIYTHIFKILSFCKYKYSDRIILESIHELIHKKDIFSEFQHIMNILLDTNLIHDTLKLLDNEFWTKITFFHPFHSYRKPKLNPIHESNEVYLHDNCSDYTSSPDLYNDTTDSYDDEYDDLESLNEDEFNTLFETLEFENKIEENILNSLSNITDNSLNKT